MLIPNIHTSLISGQELHILNSAMTLLIRVEHRQLTMSHIGKSAGVSRTSLYKYFSSVNHIMFRLLLANEMEFMELTDKWRKLPDLILVIREYVRFRITSTEKFSLLYQLARNLDFADIEEAEDWRRLRDNNRRNLDALITLFLAQKDPEEVKLRLLLFHGLVRGMGMSAGPEKKVLQSAQQIRQVLDQVPDAGLRLLTAS